jgi:uncharacterized protein (DUF169 family)
MRMEMNRMADLKVYHEYGEEIERIVRLKTYPLALKLLEKEEDIPDGAQRPLRDFGYRLSLCQAYQVSRREGQTVAMLAKDMWCFEPVIGYGLVEAPEYFMEGHNRYPKDVSTLEAGSHYAQELPKLELGKYVGVVSAPLKTANFKPDAVMMYCDSTQLSLLLLGREWKDGHNLKCALSSHAACVYSAVSTVLSQECHVSVPCRGDRYHAMAGDEEMIFAVPEKKLEDLVTGLRYVEKTGSKLPRGYGLQPEYEEPPAYAKIAQMMGYR